MYDILKAIAQIIERFVVGDTPLRSIVSAGNTTIPVSTSRRYCIGDRIVLHEDSNILTAEGFMRTVVTKPDNRTITIDEPISEDLPSGTHVKKLVGLDTGHETFLRSVFIGDPAVINQNSLPAITVDGRSRSSEWITLESTGETFNIDITVYVLASDYEAQYELMHRYATAIENSLFRSFYPLAMPFDSTTLAEDAVELDTIMKVTDQDFFECSGGHFFMENFDTVHFNRVKADLGNGVIETKVPIQSDFNAVDTTVIVPKRHIYNALPASTDYGVINKNAMLKSARISYVCTEERYRLAPYLDPITF